ncbi:restriction endonuclease subunit S [Bifidobacterium imperatoris]|uniref:Type I restriction enzyme, S subunit n=1 Tax=Bifidobacterium imperatoris TaxID=2020965 RepID=A0A2N5IQD5_9BIFI|nr:restriction endonuclease subunit S [Bifidobacterium imperatoris]PLS24170.1 type I restriction enzyme, S subunit [Bifidobacterium imperatoris]
MDSNWIYLSDIASISSGGTPSKNHPEYWNGDIPWVSAKSMDADSLNSSMLYITNEGVSAGSCMAKPGDILLLVRGSGLFKRIPIIWVDKAMAFNQDIKRLSVPDHDDARYLYFWLQSQRSVISQNLEMTGIGAGKIDMNYLSEMPVWWPDKTVRKRIVVCLDSMQKLRTCLTQTNGHLLEIGQSIFDEKLKLCDLTEGNVGLLGDIAEGNPRRQLSKGEIAKYIDMSSLSTTGSYPSGWIEKAYNGGMRFANGDTLLARITPCLENGKASYVNFLNESEVAFGSTEYIILTGKDGISNEIFYFLVRNSNFIEYMVGHMNGSSGRQRVSVKDALNYPIHIPEGKTLKAIGQRLSMLLNSVSANSKQIKKLSQLRDALLPKLMSGEIDVSKVELPTPLEQNSATNGRLSE